MGTNGANQLLKCIAHFKKNGFAQMYAYEPNQTKRLTKRVLKIYIYKALDYKMHTET